jgi:hypothetical protein
MKIQVVVTKDGAIVGFGPVSSVSSSQTVRGGLIAGPDQVLKEVEVPAETYMSHQDGARLHSELQKHLK